MSGIQGFKRGMVDRIKGQEAREEAKEDSKEASSSVISRHPEGKTNAKYEHDESGFLWSWNFMISKRWKNFSHMKDTIHGQAAGRLQKVMLHNQLMEN